MAGFRSFGYLFGIVPSDLGENNDDEDGEIRE